MCYHGSYLLYTSFREHVTPLMSGEREDRTWEWGDRESRGGINREADEKNERRDGGMEGRRNGGTEE